MLSYLLPTVRSIYLLSLAPASSLCADFGITISTFDVINAVRLCVVLRQLRDIQERKHASERGKSAASIGRGVIEQKSLTRHLFTTLLVVFGGEAVVGPFLGFSPSFMTSGVVPLLFTAVQALVEALPSVPQPSLHTELPLAVVDGFTRAYLLCSLIPPIVVRHASPDIRFSPWTLMVTSLLMANSGFFVANLFSFFHPGTLTVTTPPELLSYGWTTADVWCAPVTTGLYALLTHAQPFWAELHAVMACALTTAGNDSAVCGVDAVKPLDADTARAVCTVLLVTLFLGRTVRNFGHVTWFQRETVKEKSE